MEIQKSTQPPSALSKFKNLLNQDGIKSKFNEALGKKAPMFISNLVTIASGSAELQKCEHMSIISSALMAASMDLPLTPGLGFAGIVPYWDSPSGMMKAQFQVMKKGFIQLAQRTGLFKTINVCEVYEGEIKKHNRFTGEYEFDETAKSSEVVVGYVSYFKLVNGFEKYYYMPMSKLETHAQRYSKSFQRGKGKWADKNDGGFEQMCEKTVLKLNLSTYAPLSVDINMMNAVIYDQAEIRDVEAKEYDYMDNEESTPQKVLEVFETQKGAEVIVDRKTQDRGEVLVGRAMDMIDKRNTPPPPKSGKSIPKNHIELISGDVISSIPILTGEEMDKMDASDLLELIRLDDDMMFALKSDTGKNTHKKLKSVLLGRFNISFGGNGGVLFNEPEQKSTTRPPLVPMEDQAVPFDELPLEEVKDDEITDVDFEETPQEEKITRSDGNQFDIQITDNEGGRRPFDEVRRMHEEIMTIANIDGKTFTDMIENKFPQLQKYKTVEEFCYLATKSEINTLLNSI